jgi:predicted transcriptional regulator
MTKTQAQILESIAALPDSDRRALVEHLVAAHLGESSFFDRMTPEQRTRLDQGIAEAERGEFAPAESVFDRIARRRPASAQ